MRTILSIATTCIFVLTGCQQQLPSTSNSHASPIRACRPPVREADDYYLVLGSFQGGRFLNPVSKSHTFAVFCRCHGQNLLETKTISWLPRTLDVTARNQNTEPGVNLNYHQTVQLAADNGCNTRLYLPQKINLELYRRACEQVVELESGKIKYKCDDRGCRPTACNGIHAVCDIDHDAGMLHTGRQRGHGAADTVHNHFNRWVIIDKQDSKWLLQQLDQQKDK